MFIDVGMEIVLRLEDELIDIICVYVVDLEGELGLWYCLLLIIWMGGMIEGIFLNLFELVVLGLVVICGFKMVFYVLVFLKFSWGEVFILIIYISELVMIVEVFMVLDKVVVLVNNVWRVIIEGVDVINWLSDVLGNIFESEVV